MPAIEALILDWALQCKSACGIGTMDQELIAMQSPIETSEPPLASITIRNLDDDLKRRLRVRAAERGRSMEEEARHILRKAVETAAPPRDLAAAIRARAAPLGGINLDLPAREAMRAPPRFGRGRG